MKVINKENYIIVYGNPDEEEVTDFLYGDVRAEDVRLENLLDFVDGTYMADPNEDFYLGVSFMRLFRRKADGRLFGYVVWESGSEYGEDFVEGNGHEFGISIDYNEVYVLLPVEEFTITGYQTIDVGEVTL